MPQPIAMRPAGAFLLYPSRAVAKQGSGLAGPPCRVAFAILPD